MTVELATDQTALVEAIARRVVELLEERQQQPGPRLVDAGTLAGILGVSRATVYDRAGELGAVEVGSGSRPRLRFDVETARAAWTARSVHKRSEQPEALSATPIVRRRRKPAARPVGGLLPVKGSEAA